MKDNHKNSSDKKCKRKVEFKLFFFNKPTKSDDNVAEMKKEGFRPATIREKLAYMKRNPKVWSEFPLIALGSDRLDAGWYGGFHFGNSSVKKVNASLENKYGCRWDKNCFFLGVRI